MADIFGSDTIDAPIDDNEITLATLVGESQKYKNPDELAKAYVHADATIAESRAKLAEREAEIKVLRDLVEARQQQKTGDPVVQPDGHNNQPDPATPKASDVDLSELVRKELAEANEAKRKTDNINAAAEALNKHFGSAAKAQEAIRQRAAELGVSADWLRDAASQSVPAFLASMGVNPNATSNSTPAPRNEVNLQPSNGTRNFKYWEELRKKSPSVFFKAETQQAMFTARRELGDKFYV